MKSFDTVKNESTCLKRQVVCELYDIDDNLLSRESNRCNPPDGICSRIGLKQPKNNYDVESTCNWTHAEIMALKALKSDAKPYRAMLTGHDFFCNECEKALIKAGVVEFQIVNKNKIVRYEPTVLNR